MGSVSVSLLRYWSLSWSDVFNCMIGLWRLSLITHFIKRVIAITSI